MRVIAGKYRSRSLRSLPGLDVRPTSDRLRETLFNVLTAGNPAALEGSVWLDLFAGTGAVGIEALSRGARKVYFAENSAAAVELIEANLKSLGISGGFKIMHQDAGAALRKMKLDILTADFVFLDPPYRMEKAYADALNGLAESPFVTSATVVIAEHEKQFDPGDSFGTLRRVRRLAQGSTTLSFYRRVETADAAAEVPR